MSREMFSVIMFGGIAVVYVFACWLGRTKDPLDTSSVWREYARRMGDKSFLPGRYSWLAPNTTTSQAKIEGVRNGISFEAELVNWDPTESPTEQTTSFIASPRWVPKGGSIYLTDTEEPADWTHSAPVPAIRGKRINAYVHPPELARVFDDPVAARAFTDFDRLRNVTAWLTPETMIITMLTWCYDEAQLDATIDVLTRMCALTPNRGRER